MTLDRSKISALVKQYALSGAQPHEFMRTTYVVVPSTDLDDRAAAGPGHEFDAEDDALAAAERLDTERPLGVADEGWTVDEIAWVKDLEGNWLEMPN